MRSAPEAMRIGSPNVPSKTSEGDEVAPRLLQLLLGLAHELAEVRRGLRRGVEDAHHGFGRDQREEGRDRLGGFGDRPELLLRGGDLGDVVVGGFLDLGHQSRDLLDAGDLTEVEQCAALAQHVRRRADPGADDAVSGAQVMVEEGERRADREGVEPQRHLGELHRHRILVDAIDDPLQHHAPRDMAVVELGFDDRPAPLLRLRKDSFAKASNAGGERRGIVAPVDHRLGVLNRVEHAVGQPVDQADQEMARAHGRIDDTKRQDGDCGIEACQFLQPHRDRPPVARQRLRCRAEGFDALVY